MKSIHVRSILLTRCCVSMCVSLLCASWMNGKGCERVVWKGGVLFVVDALMGVVLTQNTFQRFAPSSCFEQHAATVDLSAVGEDQGRTDLTTAGAPQQRIAPAPPWSRHPRWRGRRYERHSVREQQ